MNSAKIRQKLHKITHSQPFEFFIITIIVVSAVSLGAKTYDIHPHTILVLDILNGIITGIFLIEILMRIMAEEKTKNFFKSGWNVFDFTIVFLSVIPLEHGHTVLIARLLRVFRLLRLVSFIPELRYLINSFLAATPRIGYITLLIFIIFYIYASIGSIIFSGVNDDLWGNVNYALLTLFRVITLEDWTDIMYETLEVHPWSWIYYISFIFIIAYVFLNMMIGIIVNQMSKHDETYFEQEIPIVEKKLDTVIQLLNNSLPDSEEKRALITQHEQDMADHQNKPDLVKPKSADKD